MFTFGKHKNSSNNFVSTTERAYIRYLNFQPYISKVVIVKAAAN